MIEICSDEETWRREMKTVEEAYLHLRWPESEYIFSTFSFWVNYSFKAYFYRPTQSRKADCAFVCRDELYICLRWTLSAGILLSFQLGDALSGQSLGKAFPEYMGYCTLGLYCLPALPQKILPQNLMLLGFLSHISPCVFLFNLSYRLK